MNSGGTLRPRALARISTCFGERMRLGDDVIATEAEALQRGYRSRLIIAPMALGAAGRERVAGHDVAGLAGRASPDRAAPCGCP